MAEENLRLGFVPKRHRESLARHRRDKWRGSRDGGVSGSTQAALADRGLVEIRWKTRPYRHMVARLTDLGARYLELHDPVWKAAEAGRAALAEIDSVRLAKGVSRHCGGSVPCWSAFGDARVGVKWAELPEAEREALEEEARR